MKNFSEGIRLFNYTNTKGCNVKKSQGFSTDNHEFFLVNECKVSYQRSHMFLCKATVMVGTHLCTNILKCTLSAEVCTPNADNYFQGCKFC